MDERRKRKRNAEQRGSVPTASFDAARALQSALAIRRSTTALCQWDYSSQGSTWARLRDTQAKRGGVPRQPMWHFQRCTSRAGHSAGRLMPRPPGCDGDEPPPAGTASRSDQPASPADVLHGERDWASILRMKVRCQSISICSNKSRTCVERIFAPRAPFGLKIRGTEINSDKSVGYQRSRTATCICPCDSLSISVLNQNAGATIDSI